MRKGSKRTGEVQRPAAQPTPKADAYRDLLETLRSLHVDQRVLDSAEKVVREREAKLVAQE